MTSLVKRKCYETVTFHSFAVPLTAIAVVEASVIMVYCAAFFCSANNSNVVGLISSLRSELCFKKANVKPTKRSRLCLFRLRSGPEKVVALGYPYAKISLKENDVLTLLLIPVVVAMLMPTTRITSTVTVHL